MRTSVQTKEVREAILDATDLLLSRYGYSKMTIDDLAKEVGIGKGSIYLHFESKEEIALSHIDRIISRLCTRLTEISIEKTSHETKLKRMLMTRVSFRFESVQHYSQSINDLLSSLRAKLLVRRKGYHEKEAKIFAAAIRKGQKEGAFAKGNALEKARSFLLATDSLLPFNLSTEELGEREEIEQKANRIAKILLKGIKTSG